MEQVLQLGNSELSSILHHHFGGRISGLHEERVCLEKCRSQSMSFEQVSG